MNVTDVNEAPTFGQTGYTFALAENADGSTDRVSLGTVAATDPEGATLAYSLAGGNESGSFEVGATSGELFYTGSGEDFESGHDPIHPHRARERRERERRDHRHRRRHRRGRHAGDLGDRCRGHRGRRYRDGVPRDAGAPVDGDRDGELCDRRRHGEGRRGLHGHVGHAHPSHRRRPRRRWRWPSSTTRWRTTGRRSGWYSAVPPERLWQTATPLARF